MRKCATCKKEQPLSEFRKDKSRKDGIHRTCKECNKNSQRIWYQKNKKKAQKESNKRYHKNKNKISARRKAQRKKDPLKFREQAKKRYNLKIAKTYAWRAAGIKNMTNERYDKLFTEQKGCCKICDTPQTMLKRTLAVDHDHKTGEVRGLLCDCCNRALGYFRDSLALLDNAKTYLICHGKKIG